MASIDTTGVDRSSAARRTQPKRGGTRRARRPFSATSFEDYLGRIASRDCSQGRLSVAALTAGCCAAQLEAECRQLQFYRAQAPGPSRVEPLIVGLRRARTRLSVLTDRALAIETASPFRLVLPDSSFEERFRQQVASEQVLTEFVVVGVEAASLIVTISRLARHVRSDVPGGAPSEQALLAAASTAVLDVIQRGLRVSTLQDPRVRADAFRALCRLRPLCMVCDVDDADQLQHTVEKEDRSRWN